MDVAIAVGHVAVARGVASGRGEVSGQHVVAVDGGVEVLEVVCRQKEAVKTCLQAERGCQNMPAGRERLSEHVCRQKEAVRTCVQAERGCHNMSAGRKRLSQHVCR